MKPFNSVSELQKYIVRLVVKKVVPNRVKRMLRQVSYCVKDVKMEQHVLDAKVRADTSLEQDTQGWKDDGWISALASVRRRLLPSELCQIASEIELSLTEDDLDDVTSGERHDDESGDEPL